ncbi:MAG TPA: UbiA family prenyltransferase [Gemmatimonadaceae bacterium]|nr:UbiA family prenyltransferase [Gemmatimonadaceae bacterium]
MTTYAHAHLHEARVTPPRETADGHRAVDDVPLVVDLDGTLIRGDLLSEGLIHLLFHKPLSLFGAARSLIRGRASLKCYVAREAAVDIGALAVDPDVLTLVRSARDQRRHIVLATGAAGPHPHTLAATYGISEVITSSESTNLTGRAKLAALLERYPEFDYVGNALTDLPLWKAARVPYAANTSRHCLWRLRRERANAVRLTPARSVAREVVRELRPHQWAKNLLLFLPAIAAHIALSWNLLRVLAQGFAAFSFCASAIYVVNDIVDLPRDRRHPTKRLRPIAASTLQPATALAVAIGLAAATVLLALSLPAGFEIALACYAATSLVYSFSLKRRLLVDVIALASLYTIRIIAGAALTGISLSQWFLAFSLFLFFALATAKRVSELRNQLAPDTAPNGRAYQRTDEFALLALGTAATAATCLVYCLYVTSPDALRVYARPVVLWCGLPLLLYWQSRVWVFAFRGTLTEDPVAFALTDKTSYLVAGAFFTAVLAAT